MCQVSYGLLNLRAQQIKKKLKNIQKISDKNSSVQKEHELYNIFSIPFIYLFLKPETLVPPI